MKEETEVKLRHVLNGYVTPILVTVIGVMVAVIGFFAKAAYEDLKGTQTVTLSVINEVKIQQAHFQERVITLEKNETITTKDISELKTGLAATQVAVAKLE